MVAVLWAALCLYSTLPLVALCSALENCTFRDASQDNVSLALTSLTCYNDYRSSIRCQWREEEQAEDPLELWNWDHHEREWSPCVRFDLPGQTSNGSTTSSCEYRTKVFAIAKKPEIFVFKKTTNNLTSYSSSCSSTPPTPKPLKPSQYLRARPPVSVAYRHEGELLHWSSPYPAHSSLTSDLVYQLSYRPEGNDTWTTSNDLASTELKLESERLLPGCRYEARVRARGAVGWWSEWSRVGTWDTTEAPGQPPSLQCVLDGEKEVTCSWKVKRNLAPFISYQLECQHHETARPESCCERPAVSGTETELTYTCRLTVPDPSQLLLELRATRNVRSFNSTQHIRPMPPANVSVTQDAAGNWHVEWIDDNNSEKVSMHYDICYWNTLNETDKHLFEDRSSRFLNILSRALVPSQRYRVTARTRVAPHHVYKGIPSNWAEPVEWTSNEASSSSWTMSLVYVVVSVIVATVFLTLYHILSNCRRSVMLWVKSIPSPDKSKAISDIMRLTDSCALQRDSAYYICEVQNLERSDSSAPLLTLTLKHLPSAEDGGGYDPDVTPTETDNSALSFSGPYILCPPQGGGGEQSHTPVDLLGGEEDGVFDYVRLPNPKNSRSTEDLMLHRDDNHRGRAADWHADPDHRGRAADWHADTDHRGRAADWHADPDRGSPEPGAAQGQAAPREVANNQLDYIHENSIPPPPPTTP